MLTDEERWALESALSYMRESRVLLNELVDFDPFYHKYCVFCGGWYEQREHKDTCLYNRLTEFNNKYEI